MTDLLINLSISEWLDAKYLFEWFMNHAGYLMVFVCMAIESSFLPFPSEIVVPPAVYIAINRGDMSVVLIVVIATAGAIVGALVNYFLSWWLGRPIIYKFADSRVGHMLLIDRAKVDKAENYFDKHGAVATFVGRLIPAIRQLVSIPAGLAKMNLLKFIIFTGLGAMLWNIVLALVGLGLSSIPEQTLFANVEKYNSYLTWGGIILLLGCIFYLLWKGFRNKKESLSPNNTEKQ